MSNGGSFLAKPVNGMPVPPAAPSLLPWYLMPGLCLVSSALGAVNILYTSPCGHRGSPGCVCRRGVAGGMVCPPFQGRLCQCAPSTCPACWFRGSISPPAPKPRYFHTLIFIFFNFFYLKLFLGEQRSFLLLLLHPLASVSQRQWFLSL